MMVKHAEKLNDLFGDKKEEFEKPLFMEGEEELLEMGFNVKVASHYKEEFDKPFVYQGYPTNHFFDYYLEHCSESMLETLKENKDKFRDNQVKKLMSYEIKEKSLKQPQVSTIEDYIQKNAELIQKNTEIAEELIKVNNWATHYEEVANKYMAYTKFLYDFMGNLEFGEIKPTTDELFKLNKIKEDVKNV